jgi:predicted RNA binding protein YcfA (HicA-like mRNA interferase family)
MPKLSGVNHQDAVRVFESLGFKIIRQGKHIIMSDGNKRITIPRSKPINAFTMAGIIRDSGHSIETFRSLL